MITEITVIITHTENDHHIENDQDADLQRVNRGIALALLIGTDLVIVIDPAVDLAIDLIIDHMTRNFQRTLHGIGHKCLNHGGTHP